MKFSIFISGTPTDYECLPREIDNYDRQVVSQYFNVPQTEKFYNADFYVEVMPQTKMAYYTYLHRKNISSSRSNAYFALTLKCSEGYCSDIKFIFNLLEWLYQSKVLGTIINQENGYEHYKVRTFTDCESVRREIEENIGTLLLLAKKSVVNFDSSFSISRQKAQKLLWSEKENNATLLYELKRTHKLHLVSEVAFVESEIETIKSQKESEISGFKKIISEKENQRIVAERAASEWKKKYEDLEKSNNNDPEKQFRRNVLNGLQTIHNRLDNMGTTPNGVSNRKEEPYPKPIDYMHYLPWVLFIIAIIVITILCIREPESNDSENAAQVEQLQTKVDSLEGIIKQNKSIIDEKNSIIENLTAENRAAKTKQKEASNIANNAISQNQENKEPSEEAPTYLDVDGAKSSTISIGEYVVVAKNKKKKEFPSVEWEITKGQEFAHKDGNKLIAEKPGDIQITAKFDKEPPLVRDLKIK